MWYGMRFLKIDDETDAALNKVQKLPVVPHAKAFWKRPGDPEVATSKLGFKEPEGGRPAIFMPHNDKWHTIEHVPTNNLIAQQPTVLRSKVVNQLLNPGAGLPDVHRAPDDRMFVSDGHHRLAAAMLKGHTTTPARVYHWQANADGYPEQVKPMKPAPSAKA